MSLWDLRTAFASRVSDFSSLRLSLWLFEICSTFRFLLAEETAVSADATETAAQISSWEATALFFVLFLPTAFAVAFRAESFCVLPGTHSHMKT